MSITVGGAQHTITLADGTALAIPFQINVDDNVSAPMCDDIIDALNIRLTEILALKLDDMEHGSPTVRDTETGLATLPIARLDAMLETEAIMVQLIEVMAYTAEHQERALDVLLKAVNVAALLNSTAMLDVFEHPDDQAVIQLFVSSLADVEAVLATSPIVEADLTTVGEAAANHGVTLSSATTTEEVTNE